MEIWVCRKSDGEWDNTSEMSMVVLRQPVISRPEKSEANEVKGANKCG